MQECAQAVKRGGDVVGLRLGKHTAHASCATLTYGRCGDYLQRLRALRRLQLQHLIRRQRQEGPVPRLTLEIPYTADGAVIFALLSRGSVRGGRMAARPRINHKWEGKIASRHVHRCTLSGE